MNRSPFCETILPANVAGAASSPGATRTRVDGAIEARSWFDIPPAIKKAAPRRSNNVQRCTEVFRTTHLSNEIGRANQIIVGARKISPRGFPVKKPSQDCRTLSLVCNLEYEIKAA